MSHTPGPWTYREGYRGTEEYVVQRGHEGGFVVEGLSKERAEADARLIAAAPELLEVLKAARRAISEVENPRQLQVVKTLAALDAAIAKAEGK
jgi:hypothetical protein